VSSCANPDAPETPEVQFVARLKASGVAQASAVITAVGGAAYIAGEIVLGLRLAFRQFSPTPVLGQYPKDLVLATGLVDVVLPSAVVGTLFAVTLVGRGLFWRLRASYERLSRRKRIMRSIIATVALGCAFAAAPPYILHSYTRRGVASIPQVFAIGAGLDVAAIALAIFVVNSLLPNRLFNEYQLLRRAYLGALVAFATIPITASITASLALPTVTICSPVTAGGLRYIGYGNLVASTSTAAFVTVYPPGGSRYMLTASPSSVVVGYLTTCAGVP